MRIAVATFGMDVSLPSGASSPTRKAAMGHSHSHSQHQLHPRDPQRTTQMNVVQDLEIFMTDEMERLEWVVAENRAWAGRTRRTRQDDEEEDEDSEEESELGDPAQAGTAPGPLGSSGSRAAAVARSRLSHVSSHSMVSRQNSFNGFSGVAGSDPGASSLFTTKRLILSITDTPGLLFPRFAGDGGGTGAAEFELERNVRRILREVEDRFAQSLEEESKVSRKQRTEDHFHALFYFIDPLSLVLEEVREQHEEEIPRRRGKAKSVVGEAGAGAKKGHRAKRSNSLTEMLGISAPSASTAPPAPASVGHAAPRDDELVAADDSQKDSRAISGGPQSENASFLGMEHNLPSAAGPVETNAQQEVLADSTSAASRAEQTTSPDLQQPQQLPPPRPTHRLTISAQEQKIIKRLAERVNLIPVLAKADLLTEQKCEESKAAIRRCFKEMGLGASLSVGQEADSAEDELEEEVHGDEDLLQRARAGKSSGGRRALPYRADESGAEMDGDPIFDDEPPPDGVKRIKLRSRRSFSKSHGDRPSLEALKAAATAADARAAAEQQQKLAEATPNGSVSPAIEIEHTPPLFSRDRPVIAPKKTVAIPFSAPFTLILPEPELPAWRSAGAGANPASNGRSSSAKMNGAAVPPVPPIPLEHQNGMTSPSLSGITSPSLSENVPPRPSSSASQARPVSSTGTSSGAAVAGTILANVEPLSPEALARSFQRRYRWGNIDVLNPHHSDFLGLRACIVSHHVDALRDSTQARYEEYRAERLEVRRQTLSSECGASTMSSLCC